MEFAEVNAEFISQFADNEFDLNSFRLSPTTNSILRRQIEFADVNAEFISQFADNEFDLNSFRLSPTTNSILRRRIEFANVNAEFISQFADNEFKSSTTHGIRRGQRRIHFAIRRQRIRRVDEDVKLLMSISLCTAASWQAVQSEI
jgi:hypothetical protein